MRADPLNVAERLFQDSDTGKRNGRGPKSKKVEKRGKGRQGRELGLSAPDSWPEPVDGCALASEISETFSRFVILPERGADALALWVIHAHAFEAAEISPILALTSPEKRCGKTTALRVLQGLVPKPLPSSNVSPAVVFRVVELACPTLLIDEADTFMGAREELRGILNSGHTRDGAQVLRTVGDDFEPRRFSTWAPKAVALIGRLPETIEDRAIVITMRRRKPEEGVRPFRLDQARELSPLCSKAWRWSRDNLSDLVGRNPVVPTELHDRAADNWRPLLAIAEQLRGVWPERARRAALSLSGAETDSSAGPGILLLEDFRRYFSQRAVDRLKTGDVLTWLAYEEDRPWAEWKRQAPITATQLAALLRRYGIQPRMIRFETVTARGYLLEDFADSFERYLSPEAQQPQQSANGAAWGDSGGRNRQQAVTAEEHLANPRFPPVVSPVTDWEPSSETPRGFDGRTDDAL